MSTKWLIAAINGVRTALGASTGMAKGVSEVYAERVHQVKDFALLHDASLMNIIRLVENLDSICTSLRGARGRAFEDISLRKPKFIPPELGFIRFVSWLYVLYYE